MVLEPQILVCFRVLEPTICDMLLDLDVLAPEPRVRSGLYVIFLECLLAVYYKEITVGFSTDLGADDDPVARTLLIILLVVLDIV